MKTYHIVVKKSIIIGIFGCSLKHYADNFATIHKGTVHTEQSETRPACGETFIPDQQIRQGAMAANPLWSLKNALQTFDFEDLEPGGDLYGTHEHDVKTEAYYELKKEAVEVLNDDTGSVHLTKLEQTLKDIMRILNYYSEYNSSNKEYKRLVKLICYFTH